jgi:AcrR family transcriptional regulator
MGTQERIEREKQEKRARILDAARELFLERGVEAVTLREVAQKIEYSTTAIYVQFADKAALVEAMVTEDFARFAAGLEAVAKVEDPVERLAALQDAYLDFALKMPRHYQLLFLTPATKHHAKEQHQSPAGIDGYRVLRATIDECIRAHRFRDGLTDADAIAQVIWGTVHGLVSLLIVQGAHPAFHWRTPAVLDRTLLDITMHGLLREPPKKPRARKR